MATPERDSRNHRISTARRSRAHRATATVMFASVTFACVVVACGGDAEDTSRSLAQAATTVSEGASTTDVIATVPSPTDVSERMFGINEGLETGDGAEDWAQSGINRIASASELGVIGTVTSVEHVPSGEWGMGYLSGTLEVDEPLFGDAVAGEVVELAHLDPRGIATSVGGLPAEVASDDRYGASFEVGSRFLTLASTVALSGPHGVRNFFVPSFGYQSTWLLTEDGLAVSVDPQRTVPLDPLVARIIAERAAPLTQQSSEELWLRDLATLRNPLATELELPPPTTMPPLPPESGPLPSLVESGDSFVLAGPAGHDDVSATLGRTDTGGFAIAVQDGTGQTAQAGAPDLATLAASSSVALFAGDELVLAGFGEAGADPANIAVTTDRGEIPAFTVGVWQVEQRPVVLVVVPVGTTTVTVTGLFADAPTVWTLPPDPYQILGDSAPTTSNP